MKIVDLSHALHNKMSVYPGDESPKFKLNSKLAKMNIFVTSMAINTHLGTHIDCPSHLGDKKVFAENVKLSKCLGKATVIDARDYIIDSEILFNAVTNRHLEYDYLLFYTGHDKFWGRDSYFTKAPFLSDNLAKKIAKSSIKGIGIDTGNVDKYGNLDFSNHHLILGNEKMIVENLKNLDKLLGKDFIFIALPLKIEYGEGSPVRAVAYFD